MASWDDQGDPRGRREDDQDPDPLAGVTERIRCALNAWRYDVHDEENGEPEGYPDGVREHLRATGEWYPQGTVWTPGSQVPADVPDAPSPARDGGTEPPTYRGPGAARHERTSRRTRRWWRRR